MHPSIGSFGFGTFKDFIFQIWTTHLKKNKEKETKQKKTKKWLRLCEFFPFQNKSTYIYIYKEIQPNRLKKKAVLFKCRLFGFLFSHKSNKVQPK